MADSSRPGIGLKVTGIAFMVLGMMFYAAAGDPEENPAAFFGLALALGGALLYFRGRQHAAKAKAQSFASSIESPSGTVFYLRAFRDDVTTPLKILRSGFTDEEEQLADVLLPFGKMIAIGRPGEKLPPPGATRMYATDSEWKSVVLEHMRSARLVVIRAGTGSGLSWELGKALTTLRPEKLLIFVLHMKVREYSALAKQLRDSYRVVLPTIEPNNLLRAAVELKDNPSRVSSGFIRFYGDWNSEFLELPFAIVRLGYNDMRKSLSLALRPVFEAQGVEWHSVGRFRGN